MAAIHTIENLLERLSLDNNKHESLEELRVALCTLSPPELRRISSEISISNVFECLNTPDKSQQQTCGEILDRLLSSLSASAVLQNFHSQLLSWMRLPDNSVKALCLPQISRLSREVPGELCRCQELVLSIVDLVSSESLDIGPATAAILTHLGCDPNGLQVLFSEPVVSSVYEAMQKNDTVRFRVYQIATDLSILTPAALDSSVQSGLLQQLVNEIEKDDILLQLNAIELVSDLAQSPHGLVFLDQHGVVSKLEKMMVEMNDNPMVGLLLPGLIKFFGGLARNHPKEVLSKFPHFVRMVLSNVGGNDSNLKGISIDTISFIGSTAEGKLALEKIGNPMTECVQAIGSLIETGTSDLKARALRAMASLVHLQVEYQTVELLSLTERWFISSFSEPLGVVWSVAQQPFLEHRIPAMHVLQSISGNPWGQKLMNNAPGFKEYVLNRATENSKEGKDEKFELVRILAHSPTSIDILGRPFHVKLMEYFNQGPFFVLAQSEVAMEGED